MTETTESRLAEELRSLGALIDYPTTPPIASTVGSRLQERGVGSLVGRRSRPVWQRARRAALLAIAATVVLAAVAVGVGTGLGGIQLRFVDEPAPLATQLPGLGSLGEPVTLAEAEARVGFEVLLPTLPAVNTPDAVHLAGVPESGGVALVYRERPGFPPDAQTGAALILVEFRRDIGPETFAKVINRGTQVTPTAVDGRRAYWIAGGTHELIYLDDEGREVFETSRFVGDTLIWESGDLTLRLENAPSLDTAVRIAESVE